MGLMILDVQVLCGVLLEVNVVSVLFSVDGIDGGVIEVNLVSGKVCIYVCMFLLQVDSVSGGIE